MSVPDFWAAIMYILLFSITLAWLPPSGYVSPFEDPKEWASVTSCSRRSPVGLVSGSDPDPLRGARPCWRPYNQDYVRTAVAKGLGTWQVAAGHVCPTWRSRSSPSSACSSASSPGRVVVETIFAWPGVGRLVLTAVEDRDYTVLQGAPCCTW